jgi:hypothetical protein
MLSPINISNIDGGKTLSQLSGSHSGGSLMTALERIVAYLAQQQGHAFCDDCLSKRLGIHPRQAVQSKTFQLAKDGRWERGKMFCSGCRETTKKAIRKRLAVAS